METFGYVYTLTHNDQTATRFLFFGEKKFECQTLGHSEPGRGLGTWMLALGIWSFPVAGR
jgi:hypothetical protein